ncbi:MAG: hypothetical protein IM664_10710 [Phenylobacterium sp.]|uniref:hypothetical protein n=2 Tax=Phenylobacterium sp. TaxID=1871053 RepID=UPI0025DAE947|nr:hypothetical protein [Phenylobacterium sp.]MCA3712490.1 hypothetical protein [Phenylobacterium sp.]MCA3733760.1 hypothetical protein [Phenylobacterium sp.]MCA4915024.1 hypothetical protein [Phenylobacterium sp.]MCA6240043.1 hypothetical protein [Phenylobacterium sp.]MCA6335062.1 hypothetical protein [Phenylobacterium sp.]
MFKPALIALVLALSAGPALAAPPFKAPRNMYGQPDLSGNWSNASLTPETRAPALGARATFSEEEVRQMEAQAVSEVEQGNQSIDPDQGAPKVGGEIKAGIRPEYAAAGGAVGGYDRGWLEPGSTVMRVRGEPRTSFLTTPDGQPPKRRADAPPPTRFNAEMFRRSADNPETRALGERCILSFGRNAGPPMFPNGFYNNNYKIVQGPDTVAILVEMVHDVRLIRLNGTHRTDGVRPWMGDSVGRWDGETLVVETINIPMQQAYRGSWRNLKVTERFTRVARDRVHYGFQVEDPTVWDAPWGGEYEFSALNGEIYEYACHEGNYALPGILAGARAEEAEAAAKAAEAAKALDPAKASSKPSKGS